MPVNEDEALVALLFNVVCRSAPPNVIAGVVNAPVNEGDALFALSFNVVCSDEIAVPCESAVVCSDEIAVCWSFNVVCKSFAPSVIAGVVTLWLTVRIPSPVSVATLSTPPYH